MSSRSSPECSPPCQGGDRGFESRRGRFRNGTVCNSAKQRSSNLRDSAGSTPACATGKSVLSIPASAGHWRAQVAVTHPPEGSAGSTPARRTRPKHGPFVYRLRTAASHAAKAGSIPARAIFAVRMSRPSGATGRHATFRTSCPLGLGSSTLPLVITGNGYCRRGWRPSGSHKAGLHGSIPGPATEKLRPSTQFGKAARSRAW